MDSLTAALPVLVARARDQYENCTSPSLACPIDSSYYYYTVDLGANVAFATLFGLSVLGFLVAFVTTRRAVAFSVAMLSGTILEVVGYGGRLMSWKNQWSQDGFLIQIICLTIAPAFMAAGLYLCLRRIVYTFGPENSRIKPETYTRLFIPCDLLSLILQAAGGGLASTATQNGESPTTGDNIMVAGLAFQVFTLLVFMVLCVDFGIRTRRRFNALGQAAFDQNPVYASLRGDTKFKCFLAALALATICIFWRSVYRVVELGEGWTGDLIRRQGLFIGFEGVMVVVACAALNVFHPAFCFKEGLMGSGGIGARWGKNKKEVHVSASGSGSDVEPASRTARTEKAGYAV